MANTGFKSHFSEVLDQRPSIAPIIIMLLQLLMPPPLLLLLSLGYYCNVTPYNCEAWEQQFNQKFHAQNTTIHKFLL